MKRARRAWLGNGPADVVNDDVQTLCSGHRLLMRIVRQIYFAGAVHLAGWLLAPKVFLNLTKLLPLLLSNFDAAE